MTRGLRWLNRHATVCLQPSVLAEQTWVRHKSAQSDPAAAVCVSEEQAAAVINLDQLPK